MRASALTTLKKLLSCRKQQVLLYRDLVTLRDDLPMVVVNNNDRNNDDSNDDKSDDSNDSYDRNEDHSDHFRYEGERTGAEAHLQGMSHPLMHPFDARPSTHPIDARRLTHPFDILLLIHPLDLQGVDRSYLLSNTRYRIIYPLIYISNPSPPLLLYAMFY